MTESLSPHQGAPARGGGFTAAPPPSRPRPAATPGRRWPRALWWTGAFAVGAFLAIGVLWAGGGYSRVPLDRAITAAPIAEIPLAKNGTPDLRALRNGVRRLERELRAFQPRGTYVVIDRMNNRLWMRKGGELVLDAPVSTGSGTVLLEQGSGRKWIFDTPAGVHRVRHKVEDPVWRKPDWAFLEEGQPLPKKAGDRLEYGMLGEYALYLGDGYLIHGTLYERLIGRSVTHGCVRVGRDDLRKVYASSPVGTKVYIF